MSAIAAAIGGGALIGGVTGLIGANMQSNAAQSASQTQAGASNYAANLQANEYQDQKEEIEPYLSAGYSALSQMQNPQFTQMPTQSQIMQYMDPSMQFQMQQGQAALEASAAARGQQFSGNTLQALNNYAQNYAQTGYQNAFNNYNTSQNTIFNRLSSLAGTGQTATGQAGQAGQNFANNAGQAAMGGANATAAGQIGSANAWAGGISNLGNSVSGAGNNWMQMSTMNRLINNGQASGGGAGAGSYSIPSSDSFQMPNFGG